MAQSRRTIRNPRISYSHKPPSVRKQNGSRPASNNRYNWEDMKPYKDEDGNKVFPSKLFEAGPAGRRARDAAHHWAKQHNAKFETETQSDGRIRIYRVK